VGGTKNPKVARIVELAPDLVLLNEEENRVEDAEALRAAGLTCHTSLPVTVEETAEMVRSIGAAVDRPGAAEEIAADIERRAVRVRHAATDRPPVDFAYLIWRDPIMVVGEDTFVSALLELAGGRNVFAGAGERYPTVTAEALAAAAPAVVLLSSEPFPFRDEHRQELAAETGLPTALFRFVDGELLSWHGSRTPDGIDYAGEVMAASGRSDRDATAPGA
jgi:ABC-type Fe3+-hydroxamate transport system substrate-binding protein